MAFTDEQVMLTLAGLTYRGFADPWAVGGHQSRVRAAVEAGLNELRPVKQDWSLVWGPATSHEGKEPVDSSMLYVVRDRRDPARHVVAIRGTNPISLADWGFGDLWVGTTVPWPWTPAAAGAAVSASTALGLGVLQSLSSRPSAAAATAPRSSIVTQAIGTLARRGVVVSQYDPLETLRDKLAAHAAELLDAWEAKASGQRGLVEARHFAEAVGRRAPALRRPRPASASPEGESDLLTFLASTAAQVGVPLDVTVTGHSKGAALAQTAALWLREALDVPGERWDAGRGARVACYAFAGPTPGNAAFARRFEAALGTTHHHVRNRHDIVTHAWQADELAEIPKLYGERTGPFQPLVDALVAGVRPLDYRQIRPGVREFAGPLQPDSRSFAGEFIYQHLDAYLHELGLAAYGIDALRLFLG
jgi:hypothetical protein